MYGINERFLTLLPYSVLTLNHPDKPANFRETNNSDWRPSCNLGYDVSGPSPNTRKRKFIRLSTRNARRKLELQIQMNREKDQRCGGIDVRI